MKCLAVHTLLHIQARSFQTLQKKWLSQSITLALSWISLRFDSVSDSKSLSSLVSEFVCAEMLCHSELVSESVCAEMLCHSELVSESVRTEMLK